MQLTTRLAEYVRACFAGIWIETYEPEEALRDMAQLCRDEAWQLATWQIDTGLNVAGQSSTDRNTNDPLAVVRAAAELGDAQTIQLVALVNFHRYLQSAELVQTLATQIERGKQTRTFFVILAPIVEMPRELDKRFVVIEHPLPNREQLGTIAREVATEEGEFPADDQAVVLDAAAGLTRMEAEGAFSLSLVREGKLCPRTIWQLKSQQLKKSGLVTLHEGAERFEDLGGLAALKSFCQRLLTPRRDDRRLVPKGVLLVSPPGCGKSALCKALGNEVGRPTLRVDMGALLGSLVGQSEANIRQALSLAEAMAPCILFLDEIEKGLAGASSTSSGDSGVATRMFGTLLTWLADRTSDVFVVATANRVAHLPPEFARAERFDGVFFIDLPSQPEREAIWQIHRAGFAISSTDAQPDDVDWTGAEIHACCRLARLLDVPLQSAAELIVPVARSAAESIGELRQWAAERCLSSEVAGAYRPATTTDPRIRRRIRIDPSTN